MRKLKVWICDYVNDSDCYNTVSKTKKDLLEQLNKAKWSTDETAEDIKKRFGDVHRVEIEFKDAFDLFEFVTGEGGGRTAYAYDILEKHELVIKNKLITTKRVIEDKPGVF